MFIVDVSERNDPFLFTYILFLLLQAFLVVCHAQTFSCPRDGGRTCTDGLYPDPRSCAHFYNCTSDSVRGCVQTHHQCPEIYAFDKDSRLCVLAVDAKCDSKNLEYDSMITQRYYFEDMLNLDNRFNQKTKLCLHDTVIT